MFKISRGSLVITFIVSILFLAPPVSADGKPGDACKDCDMTRELCFNVFCNYQKEIAEGSYQKCKAASVFTKSVYLDGNEVRDNSESPLNPELQVECDGAVIQNGSAHRYTDSMGTRIQSLTGPYPAILLPRKALRDGHRYVASSLEFDGESMEGYCYLYTGSQ